MSELLAYLAGLATLPAAAMARGVYLEWRCEDGAR